MENIRDKLKERKFEEKKNRFDKYMINELPEEINHFIHDYFDHNFKKLEKEVS